MIAVAAPYNAQVKRVGRIGLVASLAVAFVLDYPWGDWVGHTHWRNVGGIPFYSWPVSFFDIIQNLILFMPAGCFGYLAFGKRARLWAPLLALPVSFVGEWTQLYSHTRFPSATDLVCNVLGSYLGVLLADEYVRRE